MSSSRDRRLANIDRAERAGMLTPADARDERIRVRLMAVVDARRQRLAARGSST